VPNFLTSPRQDVNLGGPQVTGAGTVEDVPYTGTPPWGEVALEAAPIYPEWQQMPVDDGTRQNLARINDAATPINEPMDGAIPLIWQNDDQQGGLGVPPGALNQQSFQSGHTSITVLNPSAEQGWGQDPALRWPLYPHQQNNFPGYNRNGVFRRNGQWVPDKNFPTIWFSITDQQARDINLRQAIIHRMHGVVVADVPTVPSGMTVSPMQASTGGPAPIGEEGIPPW